MNTTLPRPSAFWWLGRLMRPLTALLLFIAVPALAHKASDAYLSWQLQGRVVTERVDLAVLDLARQLAIEGDADGQIRWGELRTRAADIEALWRSGLDLRADDRPCTASEFEGGPTAADRLQLESRSDGPYVVLTRRWQCDGTAPIQALEARYRVFAGIDPTHRGLVRIDRDAAASTGASEPITGLLTPDGQATRWRWSAPDAAQPASTGALAILGRFAADGLHHIAIGADHIAFLITLLLVSVWRRGPQGAWEPQTDARQPWLEAGRLVTAFTLSHSLTLALAVIGWLRPPSWLVESLIAASVLIAALDNLRPFLPGPRWRMVAVFGLVHGLGFAGPLQSFGLNGASLVLPLLGFNLGVEAGQLAIVLLILPLACRLRGHWLYRLAGVQALSLLIAAAAAVWLAERLAGLELGMPWVVGAAGLAWLATVGRRLMVTGWGGSKGPTGPMRQVSSGPSSTGPAPPWTGAPIRRPLPAASAD